MSQSSLGLGTGEGLNVHLHLSVAAARLQKLARQSHHWIVPRVAPRPHFAVRERYGDEREFVRLCVYLAHGPDFPQQSTVAETIGNLLETDRSPCSVRLNGSFTDVNSERFASLDHHPLAVDRLRGDDDPATPPCRYVHLYRVGSPAPRRDAAGERGDVVGD